MLGAQYFSHLTLVMLRPAWPRICLWQERRSAKKITQSPRSGLAFVSNKRLNSNRAFEKIRLLGRLAMSGNLRLLSRFAAALLSRSAAGLLASGLSGFLMIGQWGHAAQPPAYPVPASLEMMQVLRDEHDLVADMVKAQVATARGDFHRQSVASASPDATSASIASPQSNRRSPAARSRRTS
jgi:hypothetical protein